MDWIEKEKTQLFVAYLKVTYRHGFLIYLQVNKQ